MKRKILSLILVFAMTVSLLTVGTGAVEPTYGDTAGHWAESSIERWSAYGIIQGSNGQFDPNGQLTCAQLATILAKLLKLPAAKDAGFTDNTADAWYYDAINRCAAAGILNGNGDGTVTPEAPISRERAMVMLARALGIEPIRKPDLTKYTDAAQVSAYAQGYVAALIEAGIVGGVTADELAPQDNINRASTVTILDRAISTYADKAGATVKADGKGIVLVVAENVKITGAPEGTKIVVADGATGLTVNGKSVSDDQTYIVPKTEPAKPSSSSSGGYSHSHTWVDNYCNGCGQFKDTVVAAIGKKGYETVAAAITAANGSGTVTLLKATTETIQEILDGQHGSIDGLTIELPSGSYGKLELGRATAYVGSNTTYTCPHNEPTIAGGGSVSFTNVEDYIAHMTGNPHHGDARTFTRTMSNLTITAQKGATVTVNGLTLLARTYGYAKDPFVTSTEKDYNGYNIDLVVHDLAFSNINFTGKVEIASENRDNTIIDGVTFENCKFETNDTAATNGQAINFSNNVNNGQVKNLIVKKCDFTNCYQGVYTMQVRNVSVTGCTFDTTGHNAIAVQSALDGSLCNHGAVVITDNTFANIGDRIIRFNNIGADTQIIITNNTATNSGDDEGQVIKATSLAQGATYDIRDNNWGGGTVNIPDTRIEMSAQIGEAQYETLAAAIAAAQSGDTIKLLADVTVDSTISVNENLTVDLGGKTLTGTSCRALLITGKKLELTGSGTVTSTDIAVDSSVIRVGDNSGETRTAELVIGKDVVIEAPASYGVSAFGTATNETVTIYGKVKSTATTNQYYDGCAVATLGTDADTPAAIVIKEGAEISATHTNAVYLPAGTLTVEGGTITGTTGIYFKSKSMTISGGTITGNGEKHDYSYNGNGGISTGEAVTIDSCNYPGGVGSVVISGGTFSSTNADAVGSYNSNGATSLTAFITGGTFSSDPTQYLAEGFTATENNGIWTVSSVFDGGTGTAEDPFRIENAAQLKTFRDKVNAGDTFEGKTIKLMADINVSGWTPIGQKGSQANKFMGTFDGNGKTVTIDGIANDLDQAFDGYAAFFGATKDATIQNLTVAGMISGKDVAGIIGKGENTTLTNCHNKATITSTEGKAAGIDASFGGSLTSCTNSGAVTTSAAQPAGGLVAWCSTSTITECQNSGNVTVSGTGDSSQAGGLCGNLGSGSTVKDCSNSGIVSASLAGGVAGRASGADTKIIAFSNEGTVTGGNYAGGVIGDAKNGVTAQECTISGTISAAKAAGGIFGWVHGNNSSAITNCAVTSCNVSATAENRAGAGKVVGILGGTVTLKLTGDNVTDDVGCFSEVTLTIVGRTPNGIGFTNLPTEALGSLEGFVHENKGHKKEITVKANDDDAGTKYIYYGVNSSDSSKNYKWETESSGT